MSFQDNTSAPAEPGSGVSFSAVRLTFSMLFTACLGLHTAAVALISVGLPLLPADSQLTAEFPYIGGVIATILLLLNIDLLFRGLKKLVKAQPDTETLIAVSTLAGMAYSLYLLLTVPEAAISLSFFPVAGLTLALTDFGLYAETKATLGMAAAREHISAPSPTSDDVPSPSDEPAKQDGYSFEPPAGAEALPEKKTDGPAELKVSSTPTPFENKGYIAEDTTSAGGVAAIAAIIFSAAGSLVLLFLGAPLIDVLTFAAGILIIACPAAIALCHSLPYWMAADAILSGGIRLRTSDALSGASEVNTLVIGRSLLLDPKKIHITDIMAEGLTDETFFSLAATAEADSYHPIAEAINDRAIRLHSRVLRASARTEIPGCGVEALAGGATLRVGRGDWLREQGVTIIAELLTRADQLESKGKTVIFVSSNRFAKGLIAFANEPQGGIKKMLQKLRNAGVEPVMLSSDSMRTAKAIAQSLDITEYRAGCRKEDRAKEIQLLQAHGKTVALLDKLDDDQAAAASQADYVIAPKGTSAEAAEKAQIVLTRSSLAPLAPLFTMSRRVEKLARQNYVWSIIGTVLTLPIASGIVYSFGGPLLSPPIALLAALPGFFSALINTLRLMYD